MCLSKNVLKKVAELQKTLLEEGLRIDSLVVVEVPKPKQSTHIPMESCGQILHPN